MSKFLINKIHSVISLRNNSIILAIGGSAPLSNVDAEDREILDAVNRGWVSIVDGPPEDVEPFKPELTFENAKPQGSLVFPGKESVVAPAEEVKLGAAEETPAETPATKKRGGTKIGAAE